MVWLFKTDWIFKIEDHTDVARKIEFVEIGDAEKLIPVAIPYKFLDDNARSTCGVT